VYRNCVSHSAGNWSTYLPYLASTGVSALFEKECHASRGNEDNEGVNNNAFHERRLTPAQVIEVGEIRINDDNNPKR
jgi:hypothetical protein